MYNITFTYIKSGSTTEIQFPYLVFASSYAEAVALVQAAANDRVQKRGGTIVSIV